MNIKTIKNRVTGHLSAIHSRRDVHGNVYYAFCFDSSDGKTCNAKISGGQSNIKAIRLHLNGEWDDKITFSDEELKIREFDRLVKDWPYAGCRPDELAQWIRDNLK